MTMNYASRTALSFISFYLGWWACALGPGYQMPWLGPACLPLWIGLHLYFSPTRMGEFRFFVALAAFGFTLDSLLIKAGLFHLLPQPLDGGTSWNAWFAPPWLVGMWVLMGLSFESLLALRRRLWLVVLSGVVSGPLSYFFGEALNLLNYARPLWLSMTIHGMVWAVVMPVLFGLRDLCVGSAKTKPVVLIDVPPVPTQSPPEGSSERNSAG